MLTDQRIVDVLGDRKRVVDALGAAHTRARTACDPVLLSLCEQRIASLLGTDVGAAPGDAAALDLDPELVRVAIVFVEQWVIDVASITDAMVADLSAALGSDATLMNFIHAVLVVEQRLRLGLAWERLGIAR